MLECGSLGSNAVFLQNRPMKPHLAALGLAYGADIGPRYLRVRVQAMFFNQRSRPPDPAPTMILEGSSQAL